MRVRTLFEEGFAIIGGFFGTELGASLGGFIAITALGLGPLGLFVTVFICATAGGMLGSLIGNKLGDQAYDLQERIGDIICHSPNEFIGAIQ
jgi:outer membrane lipoprotein SlyB